jgi:hypothetical protein
MKNVQSMPPWLEAGSRCFRFPQVQSTRSCSYHGWNGLQCLSCAPECPEPFTGEGFAGANVARNRLKGEFRSYLLRPIPWLTRCMGMRRLCDSPRVRAPVPLLGLLREQDVAQNWQSTGHLMGNRERRDQDNHPLRDFHAGEVISHRERLLFNRIARSTASLKSCLCWQIDRRHRVFMSQKHRLPQSDLPLLRVGSSPLGSETNSARVRSQTGMANGVASGRCRSLRPLYADSACCDNGNG